MANPCWFCTSKDTHENCVGCYNKRNFRPIQTAASAWKTGEPPKDGTWIVAKFPGWLEKELMHLVFWDVPEDSPGEAGWYSPDAEDIVGGGKDPIAFIAINPYEVVE